MHKKTYICPYCFNKNDLREVEFRCASDPGKCSLEPDSTYAKYHGGGAPQNMPKVIPNPSHHSRIKVLSNFKIPREVVCPSCNKKTSIRICPTCHSELPYTIGDYKDMIFAVIGSRDSGKSHYISVLINKIMNEIGEEFNCNLHPLSEETINRYREDFYKPVFEDKETIKATVTEDPRKKIPLIYTLSFSGHDILGRRKILDIATIAFFDTAGEDLISQEIMRTENRYIYNSSGIILLLDPLQFPDVRAQLPDIHKPGVSHDVEDIIARTANLIRLAKNIRHDRFIDIPIAVAFSKIDAIDPLLDSSSGLKYNSKHNGRFDIDDFETVQSEMESLIKEWKGGYILNQVDLNFKQYGFFGLTALGCNPIPTPEGKKKIPKLRPHRVSDPFLWLLWKHKLIPGTDQYYEF